MAATATTLTLVDASRFPDAEYWVIICPIGQCGIGATAANGETVYVTGKSGNVLTIGATGRDVDANGSGTATGAGTAPTHAAGEAVVLAPPAAFFNSLSPGPSSIQLTIDGGGAVITTGEKAWGQVEAGGTITGWTLLADQACSIIIDVWVDSYANFPPTNADSITASAPPDLSTVAKDTDSTLSGWTTTFSAGDIFKFNVDSVTDCEKVVLVLSL